MKKIVLLSLLLSSTAFPLIAQANWKQNFINSLAEQKKDKKTLHDIEIIVNAVSTEKDENRIDLTQVQKKLSTLNISNYFIFNKKDSLQKMFIIDSLSILYDSIAQKKNNSTLFSEEFLAIESMDSLKYLKHYNFGIIAGTSIDELPIQRGHSGKLEYHLANIKKLIESNRSLFKGKGLTFAEYQKMEADQHFNLESKAIEFRIDFIGYLKTTYNL